MVGFLTLSHEPQPRAESDVGTKIFPSSSPGVHRYDVVCLSVLSPTICNDHHVQRCHQILFGRLPGLPSLRPAYTTPN